MKQFNEDIGLLEQSGTPATPPSGYLDLYGLADHMPRIKDSTGAVRNLAPLQQIGWVIGEGGVTSPTVGSRPSSPLSIPYDATIVRWRLIADVSGSIVLDVWKDTYANFPPTNGDSITGTDKPTLSSAQKAESTALTGWTTTIAAGDIMYVEVESASTLIVATLTLWVRPT